MELMRLETLARLNRERAARRTTGILLDLERDDCRLVCEDDRLEDETGRIVSARMISGRSGVFTACGSTYFLDILTPTPRLIMIGAVHIAQTLSRIATLAGFEAIVVDPRDAFATSDRFPDTRIITEWPDHALEELGLDRYTAIACLSHDPKIDDVALKAALSSDCGYVGALGSSGTHVRRLKRLTKMGVSDAARRICAPIGLDIGASAPTEIAVSILAEIILMWRQKPLRSERLRSTHEQIA
jgi:xanthine dehydrogenase accessory factor